MSAVAHRGNSRQRSTSVAFGAKRTLIKPRCRRGGAAHLLRRAMHWCLQQVPRPGRRHGEEAAREEAPGPRLASYSSALAAFRGLTADVPPDLRTTPTASFWRTPPSRPRASARSCGSVWGLRDSQRPASTAMAGLPARPWPRLMPSALAVRASALAAWRSKARSPRGRHPSKARRRVLRGRTQGSAPRSSRRSCCRLRRGATRSPCSCNSTCEMSVPDSRSSRLHAGQLRGGRGFHDGSTTTPSASS